MKRYVKVIGGGLAGSEASLQLSLHGVDVELVEMRPSVMTPAHRSDLLAELVCSNSLKSEDPTTASGLLKLELEMLGCRLLGIARRTAVEAGHALAVDRELFATKVTDEVNRDGGISLKRYEVRTIPDDPYVVIATGPLTSGALARAIEAHFSSDSLYFYDAISISISADSIDTEYAFKASRYGRGGEDYWNIPLDEEQYEKLVDFLIDAPKVEKRGFEESTCFEGCLPVEVIASRGRDSLRYGPLKPKGLVDPGTGREPYAVIQLRKEKREGTMYGLVGFQTRLTRPAQRKLLKLLPGFKEPVEILRWGSIHRNTFLNAPELLDFKQMSPGRDGLYFAGQLVGVEGYMESIAHGLVVSINVLYHMHDREPPLFPAETMVGGLQRHLSNAVGNYQPMNANFGLLPPLKAARKVRRKLLVERAVDSMNRFIRDELGWLL